MSDCICLVVDTSWYWEGKKRKPALVIYPLTDCPLHGDHPLAGDLPFWSNLYPSAKERLTAQNGEMSDLANRNFADSVTANAQVIALREALEFYADECNYSPIIHAAHRGFDSEVIADLGERARAALASGRGKEE